MASLPAKVTDSTAGTASSTLALEGPRQTFVIPVGNLADLANSQAWAIAVPFGFTIVSALFRTGKAATTAAKAATITLSTTGGALTGGVMALTSANQTPAGNAVAATAISGANASGTAGQSIIATVSAVTAFIEGSGYIEIVVKNNDAANALASLAAKVNAMIQNDRERG